MSKPFISADIENGADVKKIPKKRETGNLKISKKISKKRKTGTSKYQRKYQRKERLAT